MKIGRISLYLLLLSGFSLTACQGFMEIVTQSGDEGLVWPLPPTPARLRYDGEVDINQVMPAYVALATGSRQLIQPVRPFRVAASAGLMAVIDRDRGNAFIIDRFRNSVQAFKYRNGSELTAVRDVAIDGMKRIYLLDSLMKQVAVFQDNGNFIRRFGAALLWTNPDRLAVDPVRQRLYVADSFQGRVYAFSLSGVFLYLFGEQGTNRGRFSGLSDLAVDMAGNLYILESATLRIQKFDPQGAWQETIELDKRFFREPVAIAVEKDETIYVADRDQSRVVILDQTGQAILQLGGLGRRRGKFTGLADISFDRYRQQLYTAEADLSRIQVFRRTPEDWLPYP